MSRVWCGLRLLGMFSGASATFAADNDRVFFPANAVIEGGGSNGTGLNNA